MRIQINCDHKWRDWPSLTNLKFILENKFHHQVFLVNRNDRISATDLFQPHCVIIPHINGQAQLQYVKDLKKQNRLVIMLPTEGRPIYKELLPYFWGEYTDYNDVDLFLSWSDNITNGILRNDKILKSNILTTGCIRFDFYLPEYKRLYLSKSDFCRKYNLDDNKPIVTWATQYNYARFNYQNFDWGIEDLKKSGVADCFSRSGYSVEFFPKDQDGERTAASVAFIKLAGSMPDINFIIKPHPAEDAGFYQNLINEQNLNNVHFIHHEHIWNILNHTSVHLQRHCTTAIEAWFLNKPTIEMEMGNTHPFTWNEMAAGSDTANNFEELFEKVKYYLNHGNISETITESRNNYISEWFFDNDENRTSEVARIINEFLVKNNKHIRWSVINRINYLLSKIFMLNWRTFTIKKPYRLHKEIAYSSEKTDKINTLDRYITQYDVNNFLHDLKRVKHSKINSFLQ